MHNYYIYLLNNKLLDLTMHNIQAFFNKIGEWLVHVEAWTTNEPNLSKKKKDS